MSKHTEGPWTIEKPTENGTGIWIEAKSENEQFNFPPGSDYVALVCGGGSFSKQTAANARLISYAPEMLQMLKNIVKRLEPWSNEYIDAKYLIDQIESEQ